ncbi:CxxxxCH/CxxCH domain-containing protein [Streptomyces sp. NPDC088730]|uniref:CxxxxCH/CxxCH domain-containing protein n=1 Tax=Streptomyces sp. NPDC088730 TaxID=3365877 RepID=UPI00380144CC
MRSFLRLRVSSTSQALAQRSGSCSNIACHSGTLRWGQKSQDDFGGMGSPAPRMMPGQSARRMRRSRSG